MTSVIIQKIKTLTIQKNSLLIYPKIKEQNSQLYELDNKLLKITTGLKTEPSVQMFINFSTDTTSALWWKNSNREQYLLLFIM